jgi:hypothetical protein
MVTAPGWATGPPPKVNVRISGLPAPETIEDGAEFLIRVTGMTYSQRYGDWTADAQVVTPQGPAGR